MTVPALGFGTAPIMGRVSRRAGSAALERAHAAGIRHFDTARSYGWGEAEGVVGAVLGRHRREDIRIVTKCGILPVRNSHLLRLAKSAARWALALSPGLKAHVRSVASSQSFQPVRTYEIDVLGAWFREQQRAGTIRRFGFSVEGDLLEGLEFLASKDLLADAVMQVPVSDTLLALPAKWRGVRFIAHSPFTFMRRQAESGGPLGNLAGLLPALGAACRCEALVCSMFGADHLTANVTTWNSCNRPKP